jgi:hypothetical protein
MPALTRSRRKVDNKGQSHKGAEAGDGESHRDELDFRLAVKRVAPATRLG